MMTFIKGVLKTLAVVIGAGVVFVIIVALNDDRGTAKSSNAIAQLEAAPATNISATGQLPEMFNLMSNYTDIQRENKEKELTGKIVQWRLPVFEVSKTGEGRYRIQTGENQYVGTFAMVRTRNDDEVKYVESLMTDQFVTIKGRITGTTLRNIDLDPAIIIME